MDDDAPSLVDLDDQVVAVVAGHVPMSDLAGFFDRSFHELAEALGAQGVAADGPPFARYHGPPSDTVDLEVGFVTGQPVGASGNVAPGTLPGGRAARAVHRGAYDDLGEAWGRLASWIGGQGLVPGRAMWEIYVTEPTPEMDPAELVTELVWLLIPSPGTEGAAVS